MKKFFRSLIDYGSGALFWFAALYLMLTITEGLWFRYGGYWSTAFFALCLVILFVMMEHGLNHPPE